MNIYAEMKTMGKVEVYPRIRL